MDLGDSRDRHPGFRGADRPVASISISIRSRRRSSPASSASGAVRPRTTVSISLILARQHAMAPGSGAARHVQIPAAGWRAVFADLHGGNAQPLSADCRPAGRIVRGEVRSRSRDARARPRSKARKSACTRNCRPWLPESMDKSHRGIRRRSGQGARRIARGADAGDRRRVAGAARQRRQPRRRPHPARLSRPDRRRLAHQFLPDAGRQAARIHQLQVRSGEGDGSAEAETLPRDLRLRAARRRRAPALRPGRARWPALVGPARGFPHRSARPGQGADGQEHGHRAGRIQGRFLRQARAGRRRSRRAAGRRRGLLPAVHQRTARHHRQSRRRQGRASAELRAPRRRRSVSGRRRRQGHGDVFRHRQCDLGRARLLARRCVRLRRFGRLRPQGHGHHREGRVGIGQAPFPRARSRLPERGFHLRRHRRHVRRRVRQRHAAVEAHAPARRVRSSAHLPRSESGCGDIVRRARAHVQAAAFVVGRLRHEADQQGRRHFSAHGEVDSGFAGSARRARHRRRRRRDVAERSDARDPEGAGRPALERRHRHLRQGRNRDPTPMPATAPTTRSASTARTCAARWSARAATSAAPSADASRRR